MKCVSISHYIKLNYWNPDVNVNKACCRHTTDIKKDRSYTSSRINIQHNEANLSKCYLSFQPLVSLTGKHVSESEGVDHPLHFC